VKRFFGDIIIGGLLVFLSTCSSAEATRIPEWVGSGEHRDYPTESYFLGVGIAADRAAASDAARANLTKQIRVRIESELEAIESETQRGQRTEQRARVTSVTRSVVDETVAGIEIVEAVEAQGKFYVLAVLDKSQYLASLEVEMDRILAATTQLLEAARKASGSGHVMTAIENYQSAEAEIPRFYTQGALYTALSGRKYPNLENLNSAGIQTELRELLSRLDLRIAAGNQQTAKAGEQLPDALAVQALYRQPDGGEVAVMRLPVIAKYAGGERIARQETDKDGLAHFRVIATPTDAVGQSGAVKVYIDREKFSTELIEIISKSECVFYYSIERQDFRFAVHIVDRSGSRFTNVEETVAQMVNQSGYRVAQEAPLLIEGSLSIVNDREIDSPMGTQFFIEAVCHLQLKSRASGQTLASLKGQGKGMQMGSRSAAVEKAYRNIRFSESGFAAFLQSASHK